MGPRPSFEGALGEVAGGKSVDVIASRANDVTPPYSRAMSPYRYLLTRFSSISCRPERGLGSMLREVT